MYYQIADENENILDLVEDIIYVKQDRHFRYIIACDKKEAQGVLVQSSNKVYQLRKRDGIYLDESLQTVNVSQIDEETYLKLKKSLNSEE